MDNKAKLIATSGICGAIAVVGMLVSAVPGANWIVLLLAVVASIAIVVPLLVSGKLKYTLLVYLSSTLLAVFMSLQYNVYVVVPIVTFCIPFTITKVYGEMVAVTANFQPKQTLDDPFGGESKQVVEVQVSQKTRLPKWLKWVLYYVFLEVAIVLTLLVTYLVSPSFFNLIYSNPWFWWLIGACQLVVVPFDFLMRGCLIATTKILLKAKLMQ